MFLNKTKGYLSYHHFRVGPPSDDYQLSISGFSGNTTDPISIRIINGMKFTTRDRDNDPWGINCAVNHGGGNAGGWWYNDCSHINLNHQFNHSYSVFLNDQWHSLPFIEIKSRPLNCNFHH